MRKRGLRCTTFVRSKAFICPGILIAALPTLVYAADVPIRLNDSFPVAVRTDLTVVARDVARNVALIFEEKVPPELLPIVCGVGSPARTSLDNWSDPKEIRINVTVNDLRYDQFAYQLGHELGHVMLGIRRSGPLFETLAVAVSLEVLDRLEDEWRSAPPFPNWKSYAPSFANYRERTEHDALQQLGLQVQWDRQKLKAIKKILRGQIRSSPKEISREAQTVAAMVIRSEHIRWRDVVGLQFCTSPSPTLLQDYSEVFPTIWPCAVKRSRTISWMVP